jgi:hypothetical protein
MHLIIPSLNSSHEIYPPQLDLPMATANVTGMERAASLALSSRGSNEYCGGIAFAEYGDEYWWECRADDQYGALDEYGGEEDCWVSAAGDEASVTRDLRESCHTAEL